MPITKEPPEKGLAGAQKKKTGFTKDPPAPGLAGAVPKPKVQLVAEGEIEGFGRWTLDENGLLDILGSGDMPSYGHWELIGDYFYLLDKCRPWDFKRVVEIVIHPGVTGISLFAFRSMCELTKVSIPNTVTFIGERAFLNCIELKEITIPDSVTHIYSKAFAGCVNLKHVKMPARFDRFFFKFHYGISKDIVEFT